MGIINFLNAKYRDLRESNQHFRVPLEYTVKDPSSWVKRWVEPPVPPLQSGERLRIHKVYSNIAHSNVPNFLALTRENGSRIEAEIEYQSAMTGLVVSRLVSLPKAAGKDESLLPHLLSPSAAERVTALDQIPKSGCEDPETFKTIVDLLCDEAQVVVMTSGTLRQVKDFAEGTLVSLGARVEPFLLEGWSRSDWIVNARIARVLIKLKSGKALERGREVAEQRSPAPSRLLIEALGQADPPVARALCEILVGDPQAEIASKARDILERQGAIT